MTGKPLATHNALPDLAPVERGTVQSQTLNRLREAVMSGAFRPGQPITLRAAAAALGVSPMPVRAALQRLEAEGALVARGLQGTLAIPLMTRAELAELRDLRISLEGLAAERAAGQATPTELAVIETCCRRMQKASDKGDRETYVRANWDFHSAVYRAARMPRLLAIIESLWLRIGPHVPAMLPTRAHLLASMPNHWAILEALNRRDPAAARTGIAADIGDCAAQLEGTLEA